MADINGDGDVQTLDYEIMKVNWFNVGDADPAGPPTPSPCPSYATGDFDQNCRVDWGDFAIFAILWQDGPCGEPDCRW